MVWGSIATRDLYIGSIRFFVHACRRIHPPNRMSGRRYPAFFVTAGQRGGGKTTLVNMITLAALGRRAAAAGWSGNSEERKKALFSYLRQSVACIAWDNISRGSAISCPHIEAALTASDISDRVLGVSRVETVPSTTVQIFTGNSIMPRGDMASRSLMLALNVNRPDPENRAFAHADPLAWTQANRRKIVRALYTLLIAGALNRPKQQEPKTRFKTWWNIVGWPMEYAAGMIGTTVNCTELMRAGEVEDEEASAVSACADHHARKMGRLHLHINGRRKGHHAGDANGGCGHSKGRCNRRRLGRTGWQAIGPANCTQHRKALVETSCRSACMDRRRPDGRHA
jgi:hypothetical protein